MTKVTKESLNQNIKLLEHYQAGCQVSIREEYQLEAYRMLLEYLRNEEADKQMREEFEQGRL